MANLMSILAIFLSTFLTTVSVQAQHQKHGSGGQEEYGITLYIGGGTTTWTIRDWKSDKTIDDIVKAINNHLGKGPTLTLPSSTGYRGYKIVHKMNGINMHSWVLPRCKKPDLEIAILEYTATSQAIVSQHLNTIKASLTSCPTAG